MSDFGGDGGAGGDCERIMLCGRFCVVPLLVALAGVDEIHAAMNQSIEHAKKECKSKPKKNTVESKCDAPKPGAVACFAGALGMKLFMGNPVVSEDIHGRSSPVFQSDRTTGLEGFFY